MQAKINVEFTINITGNTDNITSNASFNKFMDELNKATVEHTTTIKDYYVDFDSFELEDGEET